VLFENQRVNHIRILARIGAGGMGEVWEGLDERLGRHVAVKTIRRTDADTAAARARSAREARILSRLEHPNICRLYEYIELDECDLLVMELVRGHNLREAISAGLNPAQRLEIATGICSALVAAHALSIIHRDLKPDNVMVVEDGTAKVLDFGIARSVVADTSPVRQDASPTSAPREWNSASAASSESQAHTATLLLEMHGTSTGPTPDALTAPGDVLGTPHYMSPEQARGEPATAASDMYSFGLLLYELYVGKRPYEAASAREALVRAQWGDLQTPQGIDRTIASLIRNLTSLDPHLRPTAGQALERLHWLQRRPLRRLRSAAIAIAVAGLLIGIGLSLIGLTRARREAAAAKATTDFLIGLFQGSDPQEAPNPEIKAREVLDRGAARLRVELKEQPATKARLLTALGGIYGNLGLNKESRELLEEALKLQEDLFGRDDKNLLTTLRNLANACASQGAHQRADELCRRAVAIAAREGRTADEADTLHLLATSLGTQRRLDDAETAARRALALWEKAFGPEHRKVAAAKTTLALIALDRGRFDTAELMLTSALGVLERQLGPDHFEVAEVVNNLATAKKELGRYEDAEALYRRALEISQKRLGPKHPQCAITLTNLAVVLLEMKKPAEAEEVYRKALEIAETSLGKGHPLTAIVKANLAESVFLQHRAAEAQPLYRGALDTLRAVYGAQHPTVAETLRGLGLVCADLGRAQEAESLLLESIRVREAVDGPTHPELGKVLVQLGRFYSRQRNGEKAAQMLQRAQTILEAAYQPDHPARAELRAALAEAAAAQHKPAKQVDKN
jgi:tetratricopeptide (TPR) repeat protein